MQLPNPSNDDMHQARPLRPLGNSDLKVSSVGLGCWPIAGISSLDVNPADSVATIHAAIDAGINFIDTAYSYGYAGEADRLLAEVLLKRRHEVVIASKVGQYFNSDQQRVIDGRPEILIQHAKETVDRLNIDQVDVMYLHVPDPNVPLQESAAAIAEILSTGLARYAGISNVTLKQLQEFQKGCPVVVVQPDFNMLQQQRVTEIRQFCLDHQIAIACYWVLMKGLLAGRLARDHQFDPKDRRLTYEIYQGESWQRTQDFLDRIRNLSVELELTVAQIVVAWTLQQPGITTALCGAKRPSQIQETAEAMYVVLSLDILERIDQWISELT